MKIRKLSARNGMPDARTMRASSNKRPMAVVTGNPSLVGKRKLSARSGMR